MFFRRALVRFGYRDTLRFITHGPKPSCMIIHPVLDTKEYPKILWEASEALELVKSTNWDILPGPNEPRYGWDEEALSLIDEERKLLPPPDKKGWLTVREEDEESDEEMDMDDPLWLNQTIRRQFAESCIVRLHGIQIDSYFSQGKIDEFCINIAKSYHPPKYVFINTTLTATQTDFLETAFTQALSAWQASKKRSKREVSTHKQALGFNPEDEQRAYEDKTENCIPQFIEVLDRPRMLLELFASRAQSSYAKMQVEIARKMWMKRNMPTNNLVKINRQMNSLTEHVAAFSHRRAFKDNIDVDVSQKYANTKTTRQEIFEQLSKDINKLREKLKIVRAERQKAREQRIGIVTIAIVGYSNTGKTTLMNHLTGKNYRTRDILFQTVDTHVKPFRLPSGNSALLVDGVGFVQNVPQFLFDAFHATIEEIINSHIIIHLIDSAHPFRNSQIKSVTQSLYQAGLTEEDLKLRVINVYNKCDLANPGDSIDEEGPKISALTGEGVNELLELLDERCSELQLSQRLKVSMTTQEAPKLMKFLRDNSLCFYSDSFESSDDGETLSVEVLLDASQMQKVRAHHPDIQASTVV